MLLPGADGFVNRNIFDAGEKSLGNNVAATGG